VLAADRLNAKAHEYDVLAASHAERAGLAGGSGEDIGAATAFTVAAIILREVARALEDDE
jgi:hypothetical protein